MKIPALILLATAALLSAHPDAAHSLAELNRHIGESPDDATLHLRRAELLLRRTHPEAARSSVETALRLAPDDPAAQLLKAKLLHATGDLNGATAAAEEITGRFPDHAPGWKFLARLLHEGGRTDEAIATKLHHLDIHDESDPGDFLTAALWLEQRKKPGDDRLALSVLDQADGRFGALRVFQEKAIRIECSMGRHDEALRRIRALVVKYQPSVALSLLRADICESAGRFSEAAAACDSAIAMIDSESKESEAGPPAQRREIQDRKLRNLEADKAARVSISQPVR